MTLRYAILVVRYINYRSEKQSRHKGRINVSSRIVVIVLGSTSCSLEDKCWIKVEIKNKLKKEIKMTEIGKLENRSIRARSGMNVRVDMKRFSPA